MTVANDTRGFHQRAVAGGLDDAAPVLNDLRIDESYPAPKRCNVPAGAARTASGFMQQVHSFEQIPAGFKVPVLKFDAGRVSSCHPMPECASFQHLGTM
jgi:hypothetical protein